MCMFFILTFTSHHVIAIKYTATKLFFFLISREWCNEIGWNHPLKLYFVVHNACLQSIDVCHKQRFKTSPLLFVVQGKLLYCAVIKGKDFITSLLSMPFVSHQIHVIAVNVMKAPAYEGIWYYMREWNIRSAFLRDPSCFVLCCV